VFVAVVAVVVVNNSWGIVAAGLAAVEDQGIPLIAVPTQ